MTRQENVSDHHQALRDGSHDFDFQTAAGGIQNERLTERLKASHGVGDVRGAPGGAPPARRASGTWTTS